MNQKFDLSRRRHILGGLAVGALGAGSPVLTFAQEKFPSGPIRITVPFPAGASTDFAARIVGQKVSEILGIAVVVDNKTGASGNIAADFVAKAPADGYNVILAAVSVVTNPSLYNRPSYVPEQLVPLGVGINVDLVLVTRPDFPAADLKELVSRAAAKSNGINAASPGVATVSHLGIELLGHEARVQFNHIPYRGSAPALTDVMGGQADIMIETIASALPHITAGKLKPIAALTPKRIASLPSVPTASEQGFKYLEYSAWNGFMVHSKTSRGTIQILNAAFSKAISMPDVSKALKDKGLDPVTQSPSAYLEFMNSESKRWTKVIKDADVKI